MREIGNKAETAVAAFLKHRGYKILERNFTSRFGEIDIIAQKNEYLVFIEVKMRRSELYGGGAAAVTKAKQERIRKTAMWYLMQKNIEPPVRFDVAVVHSDGTKIRKRDVEVLENAF